jgi:cellulose synthase/poly-beta-1,6-N-acetylglucosamine synthase-like glycosyltransferase
VPTIDVFLTCCKEDVDVVLDTTRAACAVDYPLDRFRIIVCDDGADPELKSAVEALQPDYPNLYYHARVKVKGKPHHFKAGNLIAATEMVTSLPGGAGEYIAALDADMIPEPEWLRAIMAHMVIDPKMALVCPPQLFYNIPDNDPLVQSLDAFVHVMEPIKDANAVAWCTGSGYAIRRVALESIGGWPTGSLAEDVCTSSMLLGLGWRTAFVHEPLQFGTVPDTFTGHLKQRTRWTLGTLQTALKLRFCLFGPLIRKMTFAQRLSGFVFTIDAFFKIFLLIALLTIPTVLLSGGTLVAYVTYDQLRWQIRLCFAYLILARLNDWISYIPSGYRLAQRDSGAQMWMAPYHSLTIVKCFLLPRWLGGKPMAFSPSGSIKSELNERSATLRAPLALRLRVIIWDSKAYIHLLYALLTLSAVTLSTVRAFNYPQPHTILVYLLTHAFWPPVLWLVCITAYCVPLRYAIWPPTVPDREDLLDRDPKTQIAHPKEYWKKQRWGRGTFWHETQYSLCTAFTAAIFFGSFFV